MKEKNNEFYLINQRFIKYLEMNKITRYAFSNKTGISETVLLNIYKGKNKMGINVIEKLLDNYNINANWLLCGIGSIQLKPSTSQNSEEIDKCSECKHHEQIIEILKEQIKKNDDEISRLTGIIESLSKSLEESR